MNQSLIVSNSNTDLITFDDDKVALIKRTIAKGATDDEMALFLHQCKRTGLDPLARQIYFQKYNTRSGPQMAIITGIDGYRLTADRTGLYAGNDDAEFNGVVNVTRYQNQFKAPKKATVTIWKIVGGQRCPFTASALWSEYYPGEKKGNMWQKMPMTMLAKCAEAKALRKAFPADLSGIYTRDEMQQADLIEAPYIEKPQLTQPSDDDTPQKLAEPELVEVEPEVVEIEPRTQPYDHPARPPDPQPDTTDQQFRY